MVIENDSGSLSKLTGMMNGVARMLEVRQDDMVDVERSLGVLQVMATEASDLLATLDLSSSMLSSGHNSELVRTLAAKQDNIKIRSGFVLLKIRDMLHKGTTEDVTSLSRRQPSPLDIPRALVSKAEDMVVPSEVAVNTAIAVKPSPFNPFAGDHMPLKYIQTGDNTKAPFQKPSTIFAPIPMKAHLPTDSKDLVASHPSVASGMMNRCSPPSPSCKSPKKRPRRDRSRSKGTVMPEPEVQRLAPGDTDKIPADGFLWRKYGNKSIKTASFKRGYYKCRHFKELKCNALKRVQQSNEDPTAFSVYYIREHTCTLQSGSSLGGAACGAMPLGVRGAQEGAIPLSFDQIKEEVDMKDEDLDWPSREDDTSGSASLCDEPESLFRPSEDAAVDHSTMSAMNTTASPLFEMPSMVEPGAPCNWGEQMSTMVVDTDDFNKMKFDACPLDGEDGSLLDDDAQLLKLIGEGAGLWPDQSINDISYWCTTDFDQF